MRGYLAFKIPIQVFETMLMVYPPTYSDTFGHHITHLFNVESTCEIDSTTRTIVIDSLWRDSDFEVFTVLVDGVDLRANGTEYHLTWCRNAECTKGPKESVNLVSNPNNYVHAASLKFEARLEFISF